MPRYLYVASGACYGGGVTTSAGTALISKYDLATGAFIEFVADFNRTATADMPAGLVEYDADNLMVLVENATTTTYRRIDLVPKNGAQYPSTLTYGGGAFTGVLRNLALLADGSTLVSRSGAVAKFNADLAVDTVSFINSPTGVCSASATLISDAIELPTSGKILFAHAAATPNNRIGLVSADGSTCLAATAGPVTTALPTDLLLHSSGRVLASYGATAAASNMIYSYVINETTDTITGFQSYANSTYVNGPTQMVEDVATGDVYVANGTSTFSNIERFSYNPNSMAMTRVLNVPFIQLSGPTRCVSGMVISE